jgi:hypothetical protein
MVLLAANQKRKIHGFSLLRRGIVGLASIFASFSPPKEQADGNWGGTPAFVS